MSTLFERITIGSDGAENEKIPIHLIRAMTGEIHRGELTPGDIIAAFNLTESQQTDLSAFLTKLATHPDPVYFGAVIFDWLAMAETGTLPATYTDESKFWARLDAELTKAGV